MTNQRKQEPPAHDRSPAGGSHISSRLARVETPELFSRWQQHGDTRARDELVDRFLPLAHKLARRYAKAHEPFEDLQQVAYLALVKAVNRFDPSRGTAFSSFAVPTILGELKRYFRDQGWSAHVPRGAQEMALKVQDALEQLTLTSGRSPNLHELAEYLELSVEDVIEALEAAAAHHSTSLDVTREDGEGDGATLADSIGEVDAGYELTEASVTISAAIRQLPTRERHVLLLRFFEDRTQTEIAKEIGVSQMQVSRILRRALARLNDLT